MKSPGQYLLLSVLPGPRVREAAPAAPVPTPGSPGGCTASCSAPAAPQGARRAPDPGGPLHRENRFAPSTKMPDIRQLCRHDVAWRTFLGGGEAGTRCSRNRGGGSSAGRLLWPPSQSGAGPQEKAARPHAAPPLPAGSGFPGEQPRRARRAGHGAGPFPAPGGRGNLPTSPRLQATPPPLGTCEPGGDGRALPGSRNADVPTGNSPASGRRPCALLPGAREGSPGTRSPTRDPRPPFPPHQLFP